MARTSSVSKILLLGILAHVSLAQAQQTPSSAPPKMERVEEGSDTPITVTPKSSPKTKIVEKRDGGVSEVQVTTGKSSYSMKGTPPSAVSQPGDTTSSTLRPPQWKVLEFDIGRKKQTERDEAAADATANAPPPPPPAAAK